MEETGKAMLSGLFTAENAVSFVIVTVQRLRGYFEFLLRNFQRFSRYRDSTHVFSLQE